MTLAEIKKLQTEHALMLQILKNIQTIVALKLGHIEANEVKKELHAVEHLING